MNVSIPVIMSYAFALIIIYLFGYLLLSPLKWALKSLLWALLGVITLVITNLIGSLIGIDIALNFFTALTAGVLGVPGVAMLLIIEVLI